MLETGQKLWLQWITGEDPGNDHVFAIDNLSVSFLIPEPASAAVLFGLGSLVFTLARRKPRAA